MKILCIRIKNLASLEGVTEIDFTQEPLYSAGIFAIIGPTGAGKSTILDALCLALYGKTPRYLQAKESGIEITDVQGSAISQGDVRGILRDGTGEGFAEVEFSGVDGHRYCSTWRVRRAREKAEGSLQQYSIALKNIDTNTDIPGKKQELLEAIEGLVGLNFEQFTRSVLLAQGDFTAFLKASKDDKSALLEKLTGTRIYSEISRQIFVNYSKENRELEDMNLQRKGIAKLTTVELEDLVREKTIIEQRIANLEKEADILNKELNWHSRLTQLHSDLNAANTSLLKASELRENAIGREQNLKQVEQVQATRTWVDGQQMAKKQLAERTAELQKLEKTFDSLQQQQEELNNHLQTANETAAAAKQKQEAAVPYLEEARTLDVQIQEKAEQVNDATTEVKTAEANYQQLRELLQDHQQQYEQLLASISQLQQWQENHKTKQKIVENYHLISLKLGDAKKLLGAIQALLPQLKQTEISIAEARHGKISLETSATAITQLLQTEKAKHTAASEDLVAIPIESLEKQKEDTDSRIEDIIGAEAYWKILSQNNLDLTSLKQILATNRSELNSKTQSLTKISEQLVVATAERDSSLRMLNKARLAAAENVVTLRSQLSFEEPCPVCGSKEHPYATEHPNMNRVLAELELIHDQNDKAYTSCLKIESSLQQTIKQLKDAITLQELDIGTKETALQVNQKKWEGFAIYSHTRNIPNEHKATWLAQQIQNEKDQQKNLQQQMHLYAVKKVEFDKLQKNISELEQRQNENSNAIKDTDRRLLSLQEKKEQFHNEQQRNYNDLAAIEKSLSVYFTTPEWFTNWKQEPELFLRRISEFAEQWNAAIQKLEENSRQLDKLAATIEATKVQLEFASGEFQRKQATLSAFIQQQNALTKKRMTIFNGRAATIVDQELKQAVKSAQENLEKLKFERELLQTNLTRTSTQKEEAEKGIQSLQEQATSFTRKLKEWLTVFNSRNTQAIDEERLLQLLAYDSYWLETERAELRALDDAITQAKSVFQERITQLEQHEKQRLSERNEEELTGLLTNTKIEQQRQTQQKNEIGFRIQQDIANKQKIGDLLNSIKDKEHVVENWSKLNEIIGSADGKKFRLIAQEYTLDVLLNYANVHLGILSNRYLLQRIPNTLGLQVIDQDMGNEVRTVYSLSGGESFLASLALALGLASLSSSRMQVESLFIDEGFGSLDPTTLNIAMDALERLHNQGRKVGVISHVQEMTERIPVQIKVCKQQSGKSKVEVIGI